VLEPQPVRLLDEAGDTIRIDARLRLSGVPAWMMLGESLVDVAGWTGPWPVDARWWDGGGAQRVARLQILLGDGRAVVVAVRDGRWYAIRTFD
jgi:protein ImuB